MVRFLAAMVRFVLLSFLLLLAARAHAQRPTEQVLYLKNGWVLRGQLLSAPTADPIRLQTADRSEFERRSPSIGCLIDIDAMLTTLPHFAFVMSGRASRIRRTAK